MVYVMLVGKNFEPGHLAKCTKRGNIQLNVVETEEVPMVLTDEVLQQLELEDEQGETCCHVLFQALAGNAKGNSMRIRAIVGKQVMVMLIDSGSSTDFYQRTYGSDAGIGSSNVPFC